MKVRQYSGLGLCMVLPLVAAYDSLSRYPMK